MLRGCPRQAADLKRRTITGPKLIPLKLTKKVPKPVEFRSEPLPLSGAMKVLKRELRAPHWEGKASAIN